MRGLGIGDFVYNNDVINILRKREIKELEDKAKVYLLYLIRK